MTADLPLPAALGSPGAVNSQETSNAGPTLADVTHVPVLPQGDEPVVVSCRVGDPDGISAVEIHYRVDPSAVEGIAAMPVARISPLVVSSNSASRPLVTTASGI